MQKALLALWSIALFMGSLALHTRHQGFPYFYHPDEPGKVEQVISEDWNFHHPMLLLSATKVALEWNQKGRDEQSVVEAGRWVSAAFIASAIVALSLLAFIWRDWAGALTAGAVLSLHHQLYELAHYMKEDSAMLMGLAMTFLAAAFYWQSPSRARAAFLGFACALAISGKYLGVLSLAVALPVLWRGKSRAAFLYFAIPLLATLIVVNLPLLTHLSTFEKSLSREMGFVVHGQRGMTRSVPHSQYWSVFLDNSTPAIWLLLGVFLVARWRERPMVTVAEWALIAFPFIYAIILSFSPKSNDRYFLPATAVITLLAVLGIEDAAHMLAGHVKRRTVLAGGAALLLIFQVTGWSWSKPGIWQYDEAFQHDDIREVIAYLNTEIPKNAVIVTDNRVGLPDPKRKKEASRLGTVPQTILSGRFAADHGGVASLIEQGVSYVLVSESDYGRFQLGSLRPQKGGEKEFARRKSFYEELSRRGELLWERERGTMIYLHPGIRVYKISKPELRS